MAKVKIQLNSNGIRALMRSDEVVGFLQEKADGIVERCNGTYETSKWIGENRANVSISTSDRKTYFKNLKNNELLKNLR